MSSVKNSITAPSRGFAVYFSLSSTLKTEYLVLLRKWKEYLRCLREGSNWKETHFFFTSHKKTSVFLLTSNLTVVNKLFNAFFRCSIRLPDSRDSSVCYKYEASGILNLVHFNSFHHIENFTLNLNIVRTSNLQ